MTLATAINVGTRVRFSHSHLFQTVIFTAKVVRLDGQNAWVEIPERVRHLPFPPNDGKRYGLYPIASLVPAN